LAARSGRSLHGADARSAARGGAEVVDVICPAFRRIAWRRFEEIAIEGRDTFLRCRRTRVPLHPVRQWRAGSSTRSPICASSICAAAARVRTVDTELEAARSRALTMGAAD
jgi:hypothetical protein